MKINLGLLGGSGKMGQAVEQMLPLYKGTNQIIPFLFVGKNPSNVFAISTESVNNIESDVLSAVDVWIDFSSPDGLKQLLKLIQKNKSAVVSGTTGLTEKEFLNLKNEGKKRKVFWASNMSPGFWAYRQALKGLKSVSRFDIAIEEIHHTQKKDKPSGTAKTIHSDLEKITQKKLETPVSLRLGGVFGVHNVIAASSNEVITLQHQALNRTVFAEGALMAADWLMQNKKSKNGYYSIDDLFLKTK